MPTRHPRRLAGASGDGLIPGSGAAAGISREPFATAVYLSPDHKHLAVVTGYMRLSLYRLDGEQLGEEIGGSWKIDPLPRVAWSSSGTLLAFVTIDGEAVLVETGLLEQKVLGSATAVAFYPDSSRLAVLNEGSLTIWQVDPLEAGQSVEIPPGARNGHHTQPRSFTLGISPDSRLLAYGTDTCTVRILDAEDLTREAEDFQIVNEFPGHRNWINDLEWLGPDTLATASSDRTIRIWSPYAGRELRVLEAENRVLGISYAPDLRCLMCWTDDECRAWSVSTGEILATQKLPVPPDYGYRYVSASPHGRFLARLDGPEISDITFFQGWDASHDQAPASVSTYANAKILLLGDSGVGKSGLALVLADEPFRPTDSTHARNVFKMPVPELNAGPEAQREVLLWDLAGQPGYRVVHQLHLGDGAAAVILFDSRSETTPLDGIGYWARALRHAYATRDPLPTFLVGARADRGVVGVSDERVAEAVAEFGFRGYLSTSAKEGWGVAELRAALLAAIDWTRMPVVTSSALFAAAKSFVIGQKATGALLTPLTALLGAFLSAPVTGPAADAAPGARIGQDLLDSEPRSDQARLRAVFEGCVARLEAAGLVKRLAFGDLVLLQPELIDVYAGAIVNAARDEPDGLGSMPESRVLDVDFRFPAHERIADPKQEKLLVIATLEELISHEIVLRETTDEGVHLVFPGAFRRALRGRAEPPDIEFTFEGPSDNIYATLVVRLTGSDQFTRCGGFQSAAQFEAHSGGICTLRLALSDEGRGTLQVGYTGDVADVVRVQFEQFVRTHLERRAVPGTVSRVRLYQCPNCRSGFTAAQTEAAISRGRTILICPADETHVSLEDSLVTPGRGQDAVTRAMDASADAARSFAAASSIVRGKEVTRDFDVFLCHHDDDKPVVRGIAWRLREHGILPWLDEEELVPGRPWQHELERQIGRIRTAAVFVGPGGFGPWQDLEMRAFLQEFVKRGCPVIPVLLPEAAVPELPIFLRGMTWVDLRHSEAVGIDLLMWGITGRRPARFSPGAGPG